ncbi:Cysteine/serine-rich nuclear protein 1 [Fasciolopsis buskii]|uniref:Cysteine/serine-rich nuclear protein 1 n=1 Tax=Fasciolopsis buskii TaxID=27845 RepID=A0A8E0VM40_9TREM|nr:Cysteine/serine-rich nuclear protein 1 [Fasciolopsis buski]
MAQKHEAISRFDVHHHQLIQRLRRRRKRLSEKSRLTFGLKSQAFVRMRGRFRGGFKSHVNRKEPLRLSPGDSCRVPSFPSPPPLSPQPFGDAINRVGSPYSAALADDSVQATPPPPCLSPPSPRRVLGHFDESLCASDSIVIPEAFDTDSEASLDQTPSVNVTRSTKRNRGHSKLLPIHGTARIKLLKESGVTRLDESEREVCLQIRATRSRVGCDCGPRYPCTPGRCSCIEEGVQCQVDRPSFPCSCVAASCQNPNGRAEFLVEEVRSYVQTILRKLAKQHDSGPHQSDQSPIPLLSDEKSNSCFIQPRSVDCNRNLATDASTKADNMQLMKNAISSPIRADGAFSPRDQRNTANGVGDRNFEWLSSTPAHEESVARKVLFQDLHTPDQCNFNASVSLPRLRSPEIAAMYGCRSSEQQVPISDSVPIDCLSSSSSPVSTPTFQCKKLTCGNGNKRRCQTPVPRKTNSNAMQHARRLLSKSMTAMVNPKASVPVDENCMSLNVKNDVLLPEESTDWVTDVIVSPFHSKTVPRHCSDRESSPVRPTSDGLKQNSIQLNSSSSLRYTDDFDSERLLMSINPSITNTNVSAPLISHEPATTKLPLCSYASCRIKSSPFGSKSAPNSPCSLNSPSLGRLSLRRRAILRLPVTPSRRLARSPRTPSSQNLSVHPRGMLVTCNPGSTTIGSLSECPQLNSEKQLSTPVCGRSKTTCATANQETPVLIVSPTLPSVSPSS